MLAGLDLDAIVRKIGSKHCVLDLKALTFVDSSGVMFFLKLQRRFAAGKQYLLLCGLTENVTQMFRITKLYRLFRLCRDVPSAEQELEQLLGDR